MGDRNVRRTFFLLVILFYSHLTLAEEKNLSELIKKFETYAEEQRKAWNIPGMAIAIIKGDETLFSKGFGQRGLTDSRPVDEDTIFQIGSLTKAFTSALVAMAVDRKEINWDDKVIDHWPQFRLKDPWVTTEFHVDDLLAQRSGLPPYAGDSQAYLGFTADQMLANIQFLTPITSFRSHFAYQNIFFLVAAHLLELRSKRSFSDMLEQEIFSVLGMNSSSSTLEGYLKSSNCAQWHLRKPDGTTELLKEKDPSYNNSVYVMAPAGGINSNIKDLIKWMQLQINRGAYNGRQLISKKSMQKMITPMIYVGEIHQRQMFNALGWIYMSYSPYPIIWHDGGTLGVYNFAAFIPEEKLGIVVLSNVKQTALSRALALQFFDWYYGKNDVNWSQQFLEQTNKEENEYKAKKRTVGQPSRPLSEYVGTYSNSIYKKVIVKEEAGKLAIVIGESETKFNLYSSGDDTFKTNWPIIEEKEFNVLFIPNFEGKISRMQISIFDDEGTGSFNKINK